VTARNNDRLGMKEYTARICLAVSAIWFVLGGFVMGYAPEWFAIAGAFGIVAAILGKRWVRVWGSALVLASTVATIANYQGQQREQARVREIRERARNVQPIR
jgi:hypothetical protein